jgi:hypothetical protein
MRAAFTARAMAVAPEARQEAASAPLVRRAAVRQRSIADIVFNWTRLTWPALARRQTAPCSRKISATSSPERATAAGIYRDAFFRRDLPGLVFFDLPALPTSLSIGLATAAMMPVATRG